MGPSSVLEGASVKHCVVPNCSLLTSSKSRDCERRTRLSYLGGVDVCDAASFLAADVGGGVAAGGVTAAAGCDSGGRDGGPSTKRFEQRHCLVDSQLGSAA